MNIDFLLVTIGDTSLYKIAPLLAEKGYTVGIISGTPNHYKDDIKFIDNNENIVYWHINDLIRKFKDKIDYSDGISGLIEKKYNIPSLHSFYFPHFYYRMRYCNYENFYDLSNHSENKILFKKTIEIFQVIELFFRENNVNFTIQNLGGELLRRVIYNHNKRNHIPNIIISHTPIPEHFVLISNEIGIWNGLDIRSYEEISDEDIKKAKKFIREFRNKGSVVKLKTNESKGIISNLFENLFSKRKISKSLINKYLNYLFKHYSYQKFYENVNLDDKYLFFPLHYHAESRLTLRDPHCWRQEFIVEYVARSLPEGYKLYVKPHPEWPLDYPKEGIKLMSSISNVRMVKPEYNSVELIKKSEAVVLINSTAGFEALIHNKPVISFGTEFYTNLGLTYDVTDLRKLPKIINEALNNCLEPKRLISFVDAFLKYNIEGNLYNLNDKNIKLIVNGILSYKDKL